MPVTGLIGGRAVSKRYPGKCHLNDCRNTNSSDAGKTPMYLINQQASNISENYSR